MDKRFILINTTKAPLGTSALVSYLHARGVPTSVLYCPKNGDVLYSEEDLGAILQEVSHFAIIGISFFAISERRAFELARVIKGKFPRKFLVVGGPGAVLDPQRVIKNEHIDAVCVHEGEISLEKLITKYPSKEIYSINGLWVKDRPGRIFRNPFQRPVQNLDKIPFINFKKSPFGFYKRLINGGFKVETCMSELVENPCVRGKILHVMASRGCPYSCSYCINHHLNSINKATNSSVVRKRSVKSLVDDISQVLTDEGKVAGVFFFDDDFLCRSELELADFAKEYKRRIGLPFFIFANPNSATTTKLDLLQAAGLSRVEFGLQTVSGPVLEKYNRFSGAAEIKEILTHVRQQGYRFTVAIDFIANSPFETAGDVIENINYILELPGTFEVHVHNLHLFPGCELRQEYGQGTGNEFREYQNNLAGSSYYNEYYTKILIAIQGVHSCDEPARYGVLKKTRLRKWSRLIRNC